MKMKLFDSEFFAAVAMVVFFVMAVYALPLVLQSVMTGSDFALGIDAGKSPD